MRGHVDDVALDVVWCQRRILQVAAEEMWQRQAEEEKGEETCCGECPLIVQPLQRAMGNPAATMTAQIASLLRSGSLACSSSPLIPHQQSHMPSSSHLSLTSARTHQSALPAPG